MEAIIEHAILNALKSDATLTALVPASSITNEWPPTPRTYPLIVVPVLISETSKPFTGYAMQTTKSRDNVPVFEVSVYASTKEGGLPIVSAIDRILFGGIPGLDLVQRVNSSDVYQTTDNSWYFPLRYQASYIVTDS